MSSVSTALIRRGTEVISAQLQARRDPLVREWIGIILIFLTVLVFGLAVVWVDYTCTEVIATLAAIEDPNSTSYIHLDNNPNDPELTAIPTSKPITSNLRSSINYLRTLGGGGIFSTCRGSRMYLAFSWVDFGLAILIPAFNPTLMHTTLVSFAIMFISKMSLATWQMAWVHVVIADQSPLVSYRRMLGYQHWGRIAPAAVLYNAAICVCYSLTLAGSEVVASVIVSILGGKDGVGLGDVGVVVFLTMFSYWVSLPAKAVFVRVAASMLPEGLDPIVPFDKRFGGKVRSEGRGGRLGVVDAWATFEGSARRRYFKAVFKGLAIEIGLGVVGGLLVFGELKWLLSSIL
ncbi:hypothetical protein AbraIFM66951_002018 [Aspergillus brasiliensis]|uniref:Uncharacterized protein n=1 Tax=Aspergillus brasiliensis TaxID=319629 RepID=A0A9W5YZA8_9EURO|nr:hypothetical protein AbraCBS73388_011762 [Aspergillus brasiliensis]GKZ49454.1 hypothetical protein AbraIFM66951_002018 [Aspergillus brasiliensis]